MSNENFISQATVTQSSVASYAVNKPNGSTADEIQVTSIGDHISYTGGYGCAIIRMSGTNDILDIIGAHSSNEYLLSKVVASSFTGDETREALMCDVLRHVAASK